MFVYRMSRMSSLLMGDEQQELFSQPETVSELEPQIQSKWTLTPNNNNTDRNSSSGDGDERRRLEFIHIPSATISHMLIEAAARKTGIQWGMYKNITYGGQGHDGNKTNNTKVMKIPTWKWPPHYFQNDPIHNPYYNADTFVVVMNPYDRMIQVYQVLGKLLLRLNEGEELTKEHMNHWLQIELSKRSKMEQNSSEFWSKEGLLVPQVDYVFNNGEQVVNYTLKVENLSETFPMLMSNYGLHEIELPEIITVRNNTWFTKDDLDITTLHIIEELYAKDFTAFAYPMLSPTRNEEPPSLNETHPPRLEFVHIPKTGGTIIESIAAKAGIRWSICHFSPPRTAAEISENNTLCPGVGPWTLLYGIPIHTCPHWHLPPQYFELPIFPNNPYQNAKLFCVVRNPYDRIISEFFYVWQYVTSSTRTTNTTKTMNVTASDLNAWISKHIKSYLSNATKGDIRMNVTGSPRYLSAAGHYIPQYDYVYEGEKKMIHHVLKFEQLNKDFDELMAMYNLNLTLPPKSSNHVRKSIKNLGVQDLSPAVIQLIEMAYANDFREFGYDFISSTN